MARVDAQTLGARQIVLAAVGASADRTVIRADAEVRYDAPHANGQQIPGSAQVLQITVGSDLAHPTRTITVTDEAQVRDLASVINNLPFAGNEQGASYSCPLEGVDELTDRFAFRTSVTGPTVATVTEPASEPATDDPCSGATLTISGRQEPELQDGGILIQKADSQLHLSLTH